jgi:hypothetical protein
MRRTRSPNWPEKLAAFVSARREHPFVWGAQDCCTFAADAVIAMTGRDPLADFRGRYSTEDEADAVIGPDGLEAMLAQHLAAFGATEIPPLQAQRGDLALVRVANHTLLGVVIGPTVAAPGLERLAFVRASTALRAWAV